MHENLFYTEPAECSRNFSFRRKSCYNEENDSDFRKRYDMAGNKDKVKFVCSNCGAESPRWLGRCPVCGEWNTMEERTEKAASPAVRPLAALHASKNPMKLSAIQTGKHDRLPLAMPEVDRPLGGGLVRGSVILLGGEPGIGKSTLVFQICRAVCGLGECVLYCSGEESEIQIKMRADRLHMDGEQCFVVSGADMNDVITEAKRLKPALLVIDSIQTMYLGETASPMGSPNQIRDCTALLVRLAKEENVAVLIIGHVTKEGNLAGPRMLEHMVDVVLYLEGDRSYQFRILRTVKNRFGSTAESGLFMMGGEGLKGIEDPSSYLLRGRSAGTAGSIAAACMEGQRALLAEIQALSVHSVLAVPRRIAVGFDYNRLIVLLAVLEKRARVPFSQEDVYVNVAGGFKVRETAADLAAALAVVSVKWDVPVPAGLTALGEIGLTGEVLPVSHIGLRLRECVRMHMTSFLLPEGNRKDADAFFAAHPDADRQVAYIGKVGEALTLLKAAKA